MSFDDMQKVIHIQNKLVNFMLKTSLESLKKYLYVIKKYLEDESSLFYKMGFVATQQILLPVISMKMSRIMSERKIGSLFL